jgi:hypothetical protein
MTLVLTGLEVESKAASAQAQLFEALGGKERFDEVDVQLLRFDRPDAPTNVQATAHLQITVSAQERELVGRQFSGAAVGLVLGGYAGFHATTPPTDASEFGVYWPALVPAELISHRVVLPDGTSMVVPHTAAGEAAASPAVGAGGLVPPSGGSPGGRPPGENRATVRAPLGLICGARSGDKGGNANVGLWTRTDQEYAWLRCYLTTERFRLLLPEADGLPIQRYELPNLRAVNFVIVGLLGDGVASSARPDPQAKGLGEYVRSRFVDLPAELVPGAAR